MALQSMLGLIWVKKVHNFWKYFDLSTKLSEFLKFQNKNFSKSQISIFPPILPWKSYNFLFSSNLVHYDMRRQIVQPKTQPRQQTNAYNCDRKSMSVVHFPASSEVEKTWEITKARLPDYRIHRNQRNGANTQKL